MKSNFLPLVLFTVCFTFLSPLAHADHYSPDCTSYYSNMLSKNVKYCVDRTQPDQPMERGEPVSYFMHGTNGGAKSWVENNYANSLSALRDDAQALGKKLPAMTFVSFDTSAYSFFIDEPGKPQSAYESWFIKEFIPFIENNYSVCNQKSCRNLIGESMGGFGALKTNFRHRDMFNAVAVNSPALPPFPIWVKLRSWMKFFSKWGRIGPVLGYFLIHITRKLMPTMDAYEAQNPIDLMSNLPLEQYPPLYFDMGGKDKYGFEVGYWILKDVLDQKGVTYSTFFEPGGHHDMWKRHADNAINFLLDKSGPAARN